MKRYFQSGAKKRKLAELNRQTTFGARSKFPIYCRLKRRKNAKNFVCAFGAPKNSRIFVRRAENASTFSNVGGFAPPSEKISAGAHVLISCTCM